MAKCVASHSCSFMLSKEVAQLTKYQNQEDASQAIFTDALHGFLK